MSSLYKLKKINYYSILFIVILLSFLLAIPTYYIIYKNYTIEVENIKKNYIQTQKQLMKNQVYNLIKYIDLTRKEIKNEKLEEIDKILKFFSLQIRYNNYQIPFKRIDNLFHLFKDYSIKIEKNNKIIYSHNFKKDLLYKSIKINNIKITLGIEKKLIEKEAKRVVIKYIYAVRFGAKNNGYISVAEILNYKGGKNFAKVVALPVKPNMVGKLLSDDKKDAKGKAYRKEYLKIANTTGEGYVSYWFYKYSDNILRPKLSFVKLYKPWNWLIFTSVFLDDINAVIKQKNEEFKKEIINLTIIYFSSTLIIFLIAIFLAKKENEIFELIVKKYEEEIENKNKELLLLNKNLEKEVEEKSKELINKMFKDTLTGLPNREKLLHDLKDNFVATININDFKEINDFFGVEEGDKLLKEFGKFLNSIYPTYKLSADEYAIINPSPAKLREISAKIMKKLKNKKFKVNNHEITLSINVGIGKTLSEADTALKYSKKKRKPIIVFNKNLPILKEYKENLKWKNIIHQAIQNDKVIPFVQGIVDNKTKKIVKYECLIRIEHEGKIYSPYFFLEIAKKTHQYETLQQIMIEKSFKTFSSLNFPFSINLGLIDLKNDKFRNFLIKKIKEYKVNNLLTIELLEDEELIKDKKINEIIYSLKKLGIKLAIDDFGSGYSNFVYLIKDLPIDFIKIDGTLVKDILEDEKTLKLLSKIVEIIKTFGLKTIAEFVENEEIYQKLKEIGVDYSQGYFFSKPFPINKLEEIKNEV